MSTATDTPRYRTYGNWTRPRSPGIYGLGTVGTVLLIAVPAAMVIGFLVSVGTGLSSACSGWPCWRRWR